MIQDISPYVLDNQFDINASPKPTDVVMCFCNGELLVKNAGDRILFPLLTDIPSVDPATLTFLFRIDEQTYYMRPFSCDIMPETEGFQYISLNKIRDLGILDIKDAFAAYTAKHLADWYRDNRYCGRCGAEMTHSGKERAQVCTECGYTSYPRIMPAVIVGVLNQDQILITKYRVGFRPFALIAGFTEIGETFEDTVRREVMEEAGIRVKNIRYYKSQPWGSANDILAGFFCEVDGDDAITMDDNELSYAEWTKAEDVILQPDTYSLTNEMMTLFKDGKIRGGAF